ncbi:MAG: HDOD domain-containing protein [Phycisphaeraceae bacterium]|nr:HDOD domain-containing protein [Phycisphaeraceae bacterium]
MSAVERVLSNLDALPTLSPIATRLLSLAGDDRTDIKEIITLIESDPSLSARVLRLSRRGELGLGKRVGTLRHAVLLLGLDAIRASALSVCVYDLFERIGYETDTRLAGEGGLDAPPFDRIGFWRHSLGVASAAEQMVKAHPSLKLSDDEAFTAGLLHDLGRIALDAVLPRVVAKACRLAELRQTDSAPIEREILGLDHHLAGKRLAERWGLPESIVNVIWLHSQAMEAVPDVPHRALVGVVSVARLLCRSLHIGFSGDFGDPPHLGTEARSASLNPAKVEAIAPTLHEQVAERARAIGLADDTSPSLLLESITRANRRLAGLNESLSRKGRAGERAEKTLLAIEVWHKLAGAGMDTAETLDLIRRCSPESIGVDVVGAVVRDFEAWRAVEYEPTKDSTQEFCIEDPARTAWLDQMAQSDRRAAPAPVWLSRILQRTEASILGLADGHTILVLDRAPDPEAPISRILAAWRLALAWARQSETSRALGEKLADANRLLGEARVRHARDESMRRLGEMTAGAAHEMNNPLMVISGRAQMLASRLRGTPDESLAKSIMEAGRDLSDLVTSLHVIARPPASQPRTVPVLTVLQGAVDRAAERCGAEGTPELVVENGLTARIDDELLSLALSELIANAMLAPEATKTTVRAGIERADGRLLLHVEDNGAGMSPRALEHAFDPFFSERPAGRRRGLGLTRAQSWVRAMGGEIVLATLLPRGTRATIALPPEAKVGGLGVESIAA